MGNLYFVVGSPNFGKTSVVRALTGVGRDEALFGIYGRAWNVSFGGRSLRTFVTNAALQERKISAPSYSAALRKNGFEIAIAALRLDRSGGLDDAKKYISDLTALGWTVHFAVLSGPALGLANESHPRHDPAHSMPTTNLTASDIRSTWKID